MALFLACNGMIINDVGKLLKDSYADLKSKHPLRLAAATAFFTTFALPPILLIIVTTFGLFYNERAMEKGVFDQLASLLGRESSVQLYSIFDGFQDLAENWVVAVSGFVFLLFVATTLFHVVRSSVNEIWNVKVENHAGILFHLVSRLKYVLAILVSGLVLAAQLIASGLQALLSKYLDQMWSGYSSFLYKAVSQLVFVLIAIGWFTMLFRYLANAHPCWKTSFAGGLFTGILFTIGKVVLGYLLTFGNLKTVFGTTGSFVLILLFVFYTSFIFYYGAAFTKKWSEKKGRKMRLEKHVYMYEVKEVRSS